MLRIIKAIHPTPVIATKKIPKVNLKIIPSLWGHIAGAGFAKEDAVFINNEIIQFFE